MNISEYKESRDIVNENFEDKYAYGRRGSVCSKLSSAFENKIKKSTNFFKKNQLNKENDEDYDFVENFENKIHANDRNTTNLIKEKDELISQLYKLKDEWERAIENYKFVDEKRLCKLSETNIFLEKKEQRISGKVKYKTIRIG